MLKITWFCIISTPFHIFMLSQRKTPVKATIVSMDTVTVSSVAVISTGRAVSATPSLHQVRVNSVHVLIVQATDYLS